ncbi:lipopolysaccharide biosynthesis protein [Reichenbachiella sp. MSK19-1]|uniref:lipopolysaccharide biosynthesis protein n=1 Tax=Reichenbachiella sp. MSK19-1 TaxID=1897631 RepID=UPI000EE7383F|nr:oligosaccharide flippase family protein [Reichenbachiella sp. MSK19-1]RJE71711.1 hypothetical protein BGP76_06385 [Reichenbachiella sp. MSK19-1]
MKVEINRLINKYFRSEFSKNVLTLVTGTSVAQLIPLLVAPILSRIYTPDDFGLLALYLSLAQILGAIANGRYELAIILPKKDEDGVRLTVLAILISVCLSIVVLIGVFFAGDYVAQLLGDDRLTSWLYFLPVSVLMIGLFNALSYYHIRTKKFGSVAMSNAYKSLGGSGVQLLLGLFQILKSGGLIIGQVGSHLFGNFKLVKKLWEKSNVIQTTTIDQLLALGKRYKDFPKFSVLGILVNTVSQNVSNIFIARVFALSDVGFYSHAYKYLGLPLNLIGNSISQVFMQKLTENKNSIKESRRIYLTTLKRLFIIGVIIFIPAYFLLEQLYVVIFGEDWKMAGTYAKILLPVFFLRFLTNPLSYTTTAFERQKTALAIHFFLLIVVILVFALTFLLSLPIILFLKALSFSLITVYALALFIYYKLIAL